MTAESSQPWRHCGRGPCWMEDGHDGPCEPGGRNDPRRHQSDTGDTSRSGWTRDDYLRATASAVGLNPDAAVAHLDQTLARNRDQHGLRCFTHPCAACRSEGSEAGGRSCDHGGNYLGADDNWHCLTCPHVWPRAIDPKGHGGVINISPVQWAECIANAQAGALEDAADAIRGTCGPSYAGIAEYLRGRASDLRTSTGDGTGV